jgi:hypothetical protein
MRQPSPCLHPVTLRYPRSRHMRSGMNILILGGGGREHALAWAVLQNPKCDRLIVAPGNAGIAKSRNVRILISRQCCLLAFCEENSISFIIVGPEAPLENGAVDILTEAGFLVFGPRPRPPPGWKAPRPSPRRSAMPAARPPPPGPLHRRRRGPCPYRRDGRADRGQGRRPGRRQGRDRRHDRGRGARRHRRHPRRRLRRGRRRW